MADHEFNPQLGRGWANVPVTNPDTGEDELHIIPIADLYRHTLKEDACPCCPVETDDGHFTHNAWDCREDYEDDQRKPH